MTQRPPDVEKYSVLLFIYLYCNYYRSDDKEQNKDGIIKSILIFFFGIIAGWTNENMAIALVFFIVALFILSYREKRKIPRWALIGLVGAIIGLLIMILAPGNYARLEVEYKQLGWEGLSRFEIIQHKLPGLLPGYWRRLGKLSLIYIALSYVYMKYVKDRDKEYQRKVFNISLLFLLSSHVAFFAMIGAPVFPLRATFGIITLALIAIFILVAPMVMSKNETVRIVNIVVILVLLTSFCFDFKKKFEYVNYTKDFWEKRELYVEEQKKAGNKDIVFTDRFIYHKRFQMHDFQVDSISWMNLMYARYFDLNTVRRIGEKE